MRYYTLGVSKILRVGGVEQEETQTQALSRGFGDAAYLDFHYALISASRVKQQWNFWVQRGPLLSLHMIFSPLSTVGSRWWGGGRVVLQSTRGTGVYWGVAATGGKTYATGHRCLAGDKKREKKRKDCARTNDHSADKLPLELFNLLMRRYSSVFAQSSGCSGR